MHSACPNKKQNHLQKTQRANLKWVQPATDMHSACPQQETESFTKLLGSNAANSGSGKPSQNRLRSQGPP